MEGAGVSFGEGVLKFYNQIKLDIHLPDGVEVMHPFTEPAVWEITQAFYHKFFADTGQRVFIIGINPGRFGGGVTGIPFTDPIRLERDCGIANDFPKKQELSSVFVYDMINAFGGTEAFYSKFYITAISPLGFTKGGKNLNYYDDKQLYDRLIPFIKQCMEEQMAIGGVQKVALCLGEGENFKQLQKLNSRFGWFKDIVPLPHPRFIMQYRLKRKDEYIEKYLQSFSAAIQG